MGLSSAVLICFAACRLVTRSPRVPCHSELMPVMLGAACSLPGTFAGCSCTPLQVIFVAATKSDNPTRKVTEKEGRDWATSHVRVQQEGQ
jgi:hypothetical protein